jgi:DNA-binding response OmpR family regulator
MSSPGSPGVSTRVSTSPPPIVVATYDQAIGRMIVMALRLEGYAPHLYLNGEEAVEAILHQPCRAAILDVRLGKVDGLTICERVRATESVASVPIILLLMRDEVIRQACGHRLGINALLFMPFEVGELLSAVAATTPFVSPPRNGHVEKLAPGLMTQVGQ